MTQNHPLDSVKSLIFYDTPISYREFHESALRLAGYLQVVCAVKRGDRVALYMQNSPQFMIAFYAILRADAMVVPVNAMLREDEVRHLVTDSGARVLFAAQDLLSHLAGLRASGEIAHVISVTYSDYLRQATDLPVPAFVSAPPADTVENRSQSAFQGDAAKNGSHSGAQAGYHFSTAPASISWQAALATAHTPAAPRAGPDDLCVLPYTSGTTGLPKGCIHTHATVMHTLIGQSVWYGGAVADSVVLCTLPLFHVTAMQASMNTPIYAGATIAILPRWDRDVAGAMIERYRVSAWTNITTMLVDFLANPDLARYDISSITRIGGGGAAMPEAVAQQLKNLTGLDYVEGYGLSETMAPSHINPPHRPKKQCLGIPIFNTEARVCDPDTLREGAAGATGQAIIDWAKEKMAAYKTPRIIEFIETLPKSASGKVQWRLLQAQENAKHASHR